MTGPSGLKILVGLLGILIAQGSQRAEAAPTKHQVNWEVSQATMAVTTSFSALANEVMAEKIVAFRRIGTSGVDCL